MAVGMTTVFGFLGLLVLAMYGSAVVFRDLGDQFEPPAPAPKPRPAPAADDHAEIAAIVAAIAAHRASRS